MNDLHDPATRLLLLGPVAAERGGEPVRIGGPRQRLLLAVLAVRRGRWVSTDTLVEEVFEGEPTDAAETTLRAYISKLRGALGDDVRITGGAAGYLLEAPARAIDAERFETLIAEADVALRGRRSAIAADRLRTALGLWRGDPFGGLGADGILRVEAERFAELRLHAVESRIDADLQVGAAAALVDELELLVREHPFREAFWRQLMLALYRSNRQADALAAYHRARAALDEQLGIEPGEELRTLEAAILRQDVPEVAPPTDRHNLPAPVSSFVGREAELSRVEALVHANRLVTLTGVGGVGKTRLAIEAARRLAPSFADGVAFVDLAPIADASLVADQITTVFEIPGNTALDPLERLVGYLRDREVLLVLDNCEHLLAACASVAARLLAMCPALRLLATSRELLGVDGEADSPVPPLLIPAQGDPALRESEAVQLFMARARAARPGMPDDDPTITTVGQICADLEGIPLAIELAAARARVLSPAEIAERLRDRFRFLVSWRRLSAARHRTLREAMDWSHDLLDPAAQQLFAELSVFAGGFTLEAVQGVCTIGTPGAALDLVQRLVEASLVTVDQGSETTRYGLLETVRVYGVERLNASGRGDELHRRHAEHFAVQAEAAWSPLRVSATHDAWLARLRADRDNYRAALAWSLDNGEPGVALRIADTWWWSWWIRGEAKEGRAWLERALAADPGTDSWRRARCAIGLAVMCWSLGDLAGAEDSAQEAWRLAEAIGDDILAGRASNTLGVMAMNRNDFVEARAQLGMAVARLRAADPAPVDRDRHLATAIDNLGTVALELGDGEDAEHHYLEARRINAGAGDTEGAAMNDIHLSLIEARTGRSSDAKVRLSRALSVYAGLSFLHYVAEALDAVAVIANRSGAAAQAAFALGAAARARHDTSTQPAGLIARLHQEEAAFARTSLGEEPFESAYQDGLTTPTSDVTRRVLEFLGA